MVASGQLQQAQAAAQNLYETTPNRDLTQRCILAEIAFRLGRDDEAEEGFRQALREAPGFADAHYGLSLLLLEQGHSEGAIEHAQFAKNASPNDARYLAQLGLCHVTVGNYPSAEIPLSQAVQLNDKDKASWNNLGLVLLAKEQPGEAHACFEKALKLDPNFLLALQNLERLEREIAAVGAVRVSNGRAKGQEEGLDAEQAPWEILWKEVEALRKTGDADAALAAAEAICLQYSDMAGPVCKLEALYRKLGDFQGGIDALQAYLVAHPEDGEALAALGSALLNAGEPAQATQALERARQAGYENVRVLTELAHALNSQAKHAEAIEFRRLAVALDPSFVPRVQLASGLVTACQYDEAIALFEELIEEDSTQQNAFLISYAVAKAYVGDFDKALKLLDEALLLQPHDASLRLQRAQINLLLGDFEKGWEDYAYRGLAYTKHYRVLPFKKWQGEALEDKCIVILAEQGLGDQVMLASCLPDLLALNPARVVLEAIGRVAPTLARSFPQCEVIHTRQDKGMDWAKELGQVDYFLPLGDLPLYFRKDRSSFPGLAYLQPDPARVAYWTRQLEAAGPRPWVGTSWRGGAQATRQVLRTMSPSELAPVAAGVEATWVSLQYGAVEEDLKIAENSGMKLLNWPEAIADLDEFAALIAALDYVVTVCNTTVHYAGALGKPVLVLAPHIPEWRYGLYTARMPWYPNVTVLRQAKLNDWTGVVGDAHQRLAAIFADDTDKFVKKSGEETQ